MAEIRAVYTLFYIISALVAVGTGAWVYIRFDRRGRIPLVANIGFDAAWVSVAAIGLWVADPAASRAVTALADLIGIAIAPVWLWFVLEYTNAFAARKRQLLGVVAGGYLLLAVGLVTGPLHGAYFASVSIAESPFPYTVTELGPIGALAIGYIAVAILIGLALLIRLFVGSRYRSSTSALLLLVGSGLATLPTVATAVGATPLPGYNHAPLGAPAYIVFVAIAAFGTGLPDISSVGRTRLVNEMADGIVAVDADGAVIDHNPAAMELTDTAPASGRGRLVGLSFEEAFPTLAAVVDSGIGGGGGASRGHIADGTGQERTAGDGGTSAVRTTFAEAGRHCSVRASVLTEQGTHVGTIVLLRDITELEEAYQRLERQNEQLERFASTITHELRNPLMILDGYVEMLDRDLAADEEAQEYVAKIETASERMSAIVDDLHRLARSGKAVDQMEPVGLASVIRSARATVADEVSVEVDNDITVLADKGVLQTLFENLLRNAADHAGPDPAVTVGATEAGFYVGDDGPGIPAEKRDRIFEYGYTTGGGSGIGLALVRTLADAHGWTVAVSESDAGGTRFEFRGVRRPSTATGDGDTDRATE